MAAISIRLRLTLWFSGVLLLGLVMFGAAMWFALEHRLVMEVDSQLAQKVDGVRTVLAVESAGKDQAQLRLELAEFAEEIPEGALIQLEDTSGRVMLPFPGQPLLPTNLKSDAEVRRVVVHGGKRYRVLTSRIRYGNETYHVLVAASLDQVTSVMGQLRMLLLFMVPAVLLVGCLGGFWLARRALAPVDEITREAKSITLESLSGRLSVPQTGDEIQRMTRTWNEVLERLEGAVKRIRQFTADASHELRTPLALMRTTAELALRRERTTEEYQAALRQIRSETEHMTQLTESLLTLARADSGRLDLPMTSTDLNPVVGDVIRQNTPAAEAKGVALKAETMDRPAAVQANAPAIRRLLLALIDNALRHTPAGGTVTVSAAPADGGVRLAVADTGEGIPVAALPHVFERFFRLDSVRSGGSGVGLGLSIAQAIAQAHGSEITVESSPGEGARFALLLRT